jgi:prepilin-type N-terminal cleavage/methylation domain-containing protein
MSSKTARSQRGNTLVESLVALALFTVMAAAIGDLLAQQIRMQGSNGTSTTAIALAEQEIEDLRSLSYEDMASRSATKRIAGATYTVQTTVVPDTPVRNMKSITAQVTWTDALGPQAYSLYAVYTDVQH